MFLPPSISEMNPDDSPNLIFPHMVEDQQGDRERKLKMEHRSKQKGRVGGSCYLTWLQRKQIFVTRSNMSWPFPNYLRFAVFPVPSLHAQCPSLFNLFILRLWELTSNVKTEAWLLRTHEVKRWSSFQQIFSSKYSSLWSLLRLN